MRKKSLTTKSNIKFVNDTLSSSLIQSIKEYSRVGEVRHSYMNWGWDIIKDSNPVLVKDLNEELSSRLEEELKVHLPEYDSIACMWYGWIKGSYIPWHSDSHVKFGATIYLNDVWDPDWGGYFAYEDGSEIKCVKPEFNKMTIITPPIQHTVFNTTISAPIRETIQIFGK
jgi:Rps23 Pro-64 3,4-dihydroxylase Tpa1-like proline 4-hydroxylase